MLEWNIPFSLISPAGTLVLNTSDDDGLQQFLLDQDKCSSAPVLRVESDDIPQMDGSLLHDQFKSGFVVTLAVEFWTNRSVAACDADLREMWDELLMHIEALVNPTRAETEAGQCRLEWQPSGYSPIHTRLFDRIKVLEWPTPTYDGGVWSATFKLHTPFPYAIDLSQTLTDISTDVTITRGGNARAFWPLFRLHGPVNFAQILNETTGLAIFYDHTLAGAVAIAGGHYAEISCFDETIYLDGSGANLKAGIDFTFSDFFPLARGANELNATGDGTCEVLWNDAWVS